MKFKDNVLIGFNNENAARQLLRNMRNLAYDYGYATKADMFDLAGMVSTYLDNKVGWTSSRLLGAHVFEYIEYDIPFYKDVVDFGWAIFFPETDYNMESRERVSYRNYYTAKRRTETEPIHITINVENLERGDLEKVMDETFHQIKNIMDREVRLAILG